MSMNYRVECHVFLIDMSSTICVRKGKRKKKKEAKDREPFKYLNGEDDLPIFQLNEQCSMC